MKVFACLVSSLSFYVLLIITMKREVPGLVKDQDEVINL